MMVWCDKLASTPGVGFALDSRLIPSTLLLSALTPSLNEWTAENDRLNFTVDRLNPFDVQVSSDTGFQFQISPSKIAVEFVHRVKWRNVTGGPPVGELTSVPMPFTTLLPDISRRLIDATLNLPDVGSRKLSRVGIISSTALDEAAMPPGISRLVRYMGRPWNGDIEAYVIIIASKLPSAKGVTDKCVHSLHKSDDPNQLPSIRFDWTRTFDERKPVRREVLERLISEVSTAAIDYLEELAEGNRFDERLLSSTA
jgi:hypothetical protein